MSRNALLRKHCNFSIRITFYKLFNYYVSDKPNCGCFLVDESHGKELFEHGVIKPSLSHSKDKVGSEDGFAAWGDVDDLNVLFPLETLSEMQIWGWAEFKTSCKKMSFPSTTFDSRKVLRAMEFASWLSFLCELMEGIFPSWVTLLFEIDSLFSDWTIISSWLFRNTWK